jgi:hypothetical protein
MNYEKEYINYLIENIKTIDSNLLDDYFLDKIDFTDLIKQIEPTKSNIQSYKNYVKGKKIDKLIKQK